MNKEILNLIEELFFLQLDKKTGWGKNDVKALYRECVLHILKEFIDK